MKRREIVKGRWKIKNGRWESYKMRRGLFFVFLFLFCFVLFFFCFSLFKTTKICLGLPKWKFSTGEKHFTPEKNQKNVPVTPLSHNAFWQRLIYGYFNSVWLRSLKGKHIRILASNRDALWDMSKLPLHCVADLRYSQQAPQSILNALLQLLG